MTYLRKKPIAIVALSALALAVNGQRKANDPALKMLKDFYTAYITEVATDSSPNFATKISAIQNKYCEARVINDIKGLHAQGDLDWDPFLKAQDAHVEDIKTLEFKADSKVPMLYTVSYVGITDNKKTSVRLTVEKKNGIFRISSVFLDTPGLPKNI